MGLIKVSYDIVTPESAEQGDAAEHGWEDESGTECNRREAVKLLTDAGSLEASSTGFHHGIWYSQTDGSEDYRTGAVKTLAYHVSGFTIREEYRIWSALRRAA